MLSIPQSETARARPFGHLFSVFCERFSRSPLCSAGLKTAWRHGATDPGGSWRWCSSRPAPFRPCWSNKPPPPPKRSSCWSHCVRALTTYLRACSSGSACWIDTVLRIAPSAMPQLKCGHEHARRNRTSHRSAAALRGGGAGCLAGKPARGAPDKRLTARLFRADCGFIR